MNSDQHFFLFLGAIILACLTLLGHGLVYQANVTAVCESRSCPAPMSPAYLSETCLCVVKPK